MANPYLIIAWNIADKLILDKLETQISRSMQLYCYIKVMWNTDVIFKQV